MNKIYVKKTKQYGRGLFAQEEIKKDQIIIINPLLIIPHEEKDQIKQTIVQKYVFEHTDGIALSLGMISLVNHSNNFNAYVETDEKKGLIYLISNKKIKKNEQIFIDYGWEFLKF